MEQGIYPLIGLVSEYVAGIRIIDVCLIIIHIAIGYAHIDAAVGKVFHIVGFHQTVMYAA